MAAVLLLRESPQRRLLQTARSSVRSNHDWFWRATVARRWNLRSQEAVVAREVELAGEPGAAQVAEQEGVRPVERALEPVVPKAALEPAVRLLAAEKVQQERQAEYLRAPTAATATTTTTRTASRALSFRTYPSRPRRINKYCNLSRTAQVGSPFTTPTICWAD